MPEHTATALIAQALTHTAHTIARYTKPLTLDDLRAAFAVTTITLRPDADYTTRQALIDCMLFELETHLIDAGFHQYSTTDKTIRAWLLDACAGETASRVHTTGMHLAGRARHALTATAV